jgi:hypothetical protein
MLTAGECGNTFKIKMYKQHNLNQKRWNMAHHLFLQIKFSWNTATPFQLHSYKLLKC